MVATDMTCSMTLDVCIVKLIVHAFLLNCLLVLSVSVYINTKDYVNTQYA